MKLEDLEYISVKFPDHFAAIAKLRTRACFYFETSAANHLIKNTPQEVIFNTRQYLERQGKAWLISPMTLWEFMLTGDELDTERLLFVAQRLFCTELLATPTELIVRYLQHAYPNNRGNYSYLSKTPLAAVWRRMTENDRVTLVYDKDALRDRTTLLRAASKGLPKILGAAPVEPISDEPIVTLLADTCNSVLYLLRQDGVELPSDDVVCRLVVVYVSLLLVLATDIDDDEFHRFRDEQGLADNVTVDGMLFYFTAFPRLFWQGPILEMAVMAAHQFVAGRRDRGILLDGMHMIYAPYCDFIMSADSGFVSVRESYPFYAGRVFSLSEAETVVVKVEASQEP